MKITRKTVIPNNLQVNINPPEFYEDDEQEIIDIDEQIKKIVDSTNKLKEENKQDKSN